MKYKIVLLTKASNTEMSLKSFKDENYWNVFFTFTSKCWIQVMDSGVVVREIRALLLKYFANTERYRDWISQYY